MSFTCEICEKHQDAGVKPVKVVIEKRDRVYPPQELPKRKIDKYDKRDDDDDGGYKRDRGPEYGAEGRGWEVAKEVNACPVCAEKAKSV